MFFTLEKLAVRMKELEQKRYLRHSCMAPFASMEGALSRDEHYCKAPEAVSGADFGIGDFFEGRDRYLWLEKEVAIPPAKEGFQVVSLFDFGNTGAGHTGGFESLLYVDGKPWQGVDSNHREVFWEGQEGKSLRLTFLLWTGVGWEEDCENTHRCRQAEFAYLHRKTDELYYFTRAIVETLGLMDQSHEQYEELKGLLDGALNHIDWDGRGFYKTAEQAHGVLMAGLAAMEKRTDVTVWAVGHTHIDVAWLWRLKHTREKALRSFSTVLRLMERYDEYVFLQSQPQLYQYIKEDCPDLYARIRERAAQGRWEPDGGMWVEADCNLSSGESLVRQFLHGIRFMEREFGKKCGFLWLPDVFGYSWALPQILKQCGIDTFMTTKISWNQYNRIPNDLFWWRGIDGSEILTYFVDVPPGGDTSCGKFFSTYNCMMTPAEMKGSWSAFQNKELSREVLVCYGHGDGGGGVTRDMLEMRRAMDAIPGMPRVKPGTAGEFFRKIHKKVETTDRYVHTWDGELYLEYHRGTYTTQGYNKKTNRRLEHKLAQIEWLSSLACILGGEYAGKEMNECWECLLLHQFHDIIPGSSIHEVYEDSRINYGVAEANAEGLRERALKVLCQASDVSCAGQAYSVYSTSSFGGKELVRIPQEEEGGFFDGSGERLEAQRIPGGHLVRVETQPFGFAPVYFRPGKEEGGPEECFEMREDGIETPLYSIAWNERGQLVRIYDKQEKRQALRDGQFGNVLELYEDKPLKFDAWDIDLYHTQKQPEHPLLLEKPKLTEKGPLRAVVSFRYRCRDSQIRQSMIVYRHCGRIDFVTHVDWQENHKLLKAAFYTDIRSTVASYDIQFGHVQRPTHWNNSWDWARFEVCAHKWADLSEQGYGVSLLNDCKYGYSIKDNVMRLSLLKSSREPDHSADRGEHEFTYALFPHRGSLTEGGVIEEASRLNLPAQVREGLVGDGRRLARLSDGRVQLDAVKKAEDEECLVLRLHECRGGSGKVTLSSDYPVKRIVPCNLLEQDCGEAVEGSSLCFAVRPFEIKSFKLYL